MPESKEHSKPDNKRPKFNKYELFDRIVEESAILIVAIRQLFHVTPLNDEDYLFVMQTVREFFVSETRGLQQLYYMVQNRPR